MTFCSVRWQSFILTIALLMRIYRIIIFLEVPLKIIIKCNKMKNKMYENHWSIYTITWFDDWKIKCFPFFSSFTQSLTTDRSVIFIENIISTCSWPRGLTVIQFSHFRRNHRNTKSNWVQKHTQSEISKCPESTSSALLSPILWILEYLDQLLTPLAPGCMEKIEKKTRAIFILFELVCLCHNTHNIVYSICR